MLKFSEFLEARIPFKKFVPSWKEDESGWNEESIMVACDWLDDNRLILPVDLENCVSLRKEFSANYAVYRILIKRLPHLNVDGWTRTGGMFATFKKRAVFNKTSIQKLCEFLHISFKANTQKYSPDILDYMAYFTPADIKEAAEKAMQDPENQELAKIPLKGRGYYNNRADLETAHFTYEQRDAFRESLPNDRNFYHDEIFLDTLRLLFQKYGKNPPWGLYHTVFSGKR